MNSICPLIRFSPWNGRFYSQHDDLIRLRLELLPNSTQNGPISSLCLASLLFEHISKPKIQINDKSSIVLTISFGYFYLLKYPTKHSNNHQHFPKDINILINQHCLPSLYDTFLPSTILERIEVNENNADTLQQIFFKSNHRIKTEVMQCDIVDSLDEMLYLVYDFNR